MAALRLLAMFLFSPLTVCAQQPIRFCFNDWPPWAEMTDHGPQGVTVSIIKEAAARIGRKVDFVERKWSECLEKIKLGEFDAVLDAGKRVAFLQGPTSSSFYSASFWVNNANSAKTYDQLHGGKIALVEGYAYDDELHEQLKELDLSVVLGKDDPTNLRNLSEGRIDVAISELTSSMYMARRSGLKVRPILPSVSADRLFTSFNRDKREIQREFDGAIASLLDDGYIDEVYQEFVGATFSSFTGEEDRNKKSRLVSNQSDRH